MTKKSDNTLLIAGGLAAVVALGALLLRRPPAAGGESGGDGTPGANYWQPSTSGFGVHNAIVGSISPYLAPFLGAPAPSTDPLAVFRPGYGAGYYGIPNPNLYGPVTSPPSTSSPTTPASGFTPAGSGSSSGSGGSGSPFGVHF